MSRTCSICERPDLSRLFDDIDGGATPGAACRTYGINKRSYYRHVAAGHPRPAPKPQRSVTVPVPVSRSAISLAAPDSGRRPDSVHRSVAAELMSFAVDGIRDASRRARLLAEETSEEGILCKAVGLILKASEAAGHLVGLCQQQEALDDAAADVSRQEQLLQAEIALMPLEELLARRPDLKR